MDRHQSKKKFAYYCRARPDNLPLPAVAVADFYRNDGENLANIKQRRSKSYWVILNPFSFPFFPVNIESGFAHTKKNSTKNMWTANSWRLFNWQTGRRILKFK